MSVVAQATTILHCLTGHGVFTIKVSPKLKVGDLKEFIQDRWKGSFLKDVDPGSLELWKVGLLVVRKLDGVKATAFQPKDSKLIAVEPGKDIFSRIKLLGDDISQFFQKLESTDCVSNIFSESSPDHLNIIIRWPIIPPKSGKQSFTQFLLYIR
jgi:hypothetical protein